MVHTKKDLTNQLSHLLADSYSLYLKTQNFHWNVTGIHFVSLHSLFEKQYTELASAIDEIAEQIRALGAHAPGSYAAFIKLSKIKDESGNPKDKEMIQQLLNGQKIVIETAQKCLKIADDINDATTADLATRRLDVHETSLWMLRSLLE